MREMPKYIAKRQPNFQAKHFLQHWREKVDGLVTLCVPFFLEQTIHHMMCLRAWRWNTSLV